MLKPASRQFHPLKTIERAAMGLRARRRQHRENLRKDHAEYEITLTMKEMSEASRKSITTIYPREIIERCQQAIDRTTLNSDIKLRIQGIRKLANGAHIRCKVEEEGTLFVRGPEQTIPRSKSTQTKLRNRHSWSTDCLIQFDGYDRYQNHQEPRSEWHDGWRSNHQICPSPRSAKNLTIIKQARISPS